MAHSENKTTPNDKNVVDFINTISEEAQKKDAMEVLELMSKITKEKPMMWGGSIIGFGSYHYKYDSGREGDFMKVGFAPRKGKISLYIITGFERFKDQLSRLGKYSTGKSCLYIKTLEDIDKDVLKEMIRLSYNAMTEKYG